jgi:hypothetical protein
MRSKTAAVLVGTAFLLAGAPLALAKPAQHQFWGQVSQLDSAARTLAVKPNSGKQEMTFTLAPDAKIMQGAKARSLADLEVGERVKVSYADEGTAHKAERIEVFAAQAKTHPGYTKPKSSP